jgi:chromosomal replication initiator protein
MVNPYYAPGIIADDQITRSLNITFQTIENAVCKAFHLQPEQLRLPTRKREIAKARQTVFHLGKKYTRKSFADIGSWYMKDHATALHACRTINNLIETNDKEFKPLIRAAESNMIANHMS